MYALNWKRAINSERLNVRIEMTDVTKIMGSVSLVMLQRYSAVSANLEVEMELSKK
jgi:hypothetical protein